MIAVGVDLGQTSDYTAIVAAEEFRRTPTNADLRMVRGRPVLDTKPELHVRYIDRFRHLPYTAVVEQIVALSRFPYFAGARFIIDATGVGRPVVDMLREQLPGVEALTITGGQAGYRAGLDVHVPKGDLMATLRVLAETRRLKVSKHIQDTLRFALSGEMAGFTFATNDAGRTTYGASGAEHDDLVLALGIATWSLSQPMRSGQVLLELMKRQVHARGEEEGVYGYR